MNARQVAEGARITHHDACFGCGADNPIGLHMDLYQSEEYAVSGRFVVRAELQGPPGYAHGGIMATALDEAMSLLVHGLGINNMTGSLNVELRSAARVGSEVMVVARAEELDSQRLLVTATASDAATGNVLATSRGVIVPDERG